MMKNKTFREMVKEYLNDNVNNIFSDEYEYPAPFSDVEMRNRIAWRSLVLYRSLCVDEMLTESNDMSFIQLFVYNGIMSRARIIEKINAVVSAEYEPLTNYNVTKNETYTYGEDRETANIGERKMTYDQGQIDTTTKISKTNFESLEANLTDENQSHTETGLDTTTNLASIDTRTRASREDRFTKIEKGLLNANIGDVYFNELKACSFDLEKFFAKMLADIVTYPYYL